MRRWHAGAGTCYAGGSTYDTAAPADEAYELPMTIDYAGDECTIKAEAKTVLAKYLDAETIEYIYGIALVRCLASWCMHDGGTDSPAARARGLP